MIDDDAKGTLLYIGCCVLGVFSAEVGFGSLALLTTYFLFIEESD